MRAITDGSLTLISRQIGTYDHIIRKTLMQNLAHYTGMEKTTFFDKLIVEEPLLERNMNSVAQQWMQEGAEKLRPRFITQGIEQVTTRMLADGDSVERLHELPVYLRREFRRLKHRDIKNPELFSMMDRHAFFQTYCTRKTGLSDDNNFVNKDLC